VVRIIKKILPFVKNKFVLAITFFVVWMLFFDQNNMIDRVKAIRQINQLKRDKVYYQEKIKSDSRKLKELRTDKDNLEKFAREQYFMKKDDEDIFVVVK
jgi:cell division protein DivIC